MDGRYYNLWSADNDKTDNNDDVVIKTVYDPSPVGYSLPASNAFTGFTTTGGNVNNWPNPFTPETKAKFNVKGEFDKGYCFYTKPNKQGGTIFFPADGYRWPTTGIMSNVYKFSNYASAIPRDSSHEFCLHFGQEFIAVHNGSTMADGKPVRSAEEKKWRCVVGSYNVLTSAALHPPHAWRGSPPFMMSWMTQSHIATPYNTQKD